MTPADYADACEVLVLKLRLAGADVQNDTVHNAMVRVLSLAAALREGQYGTGMLRLTHRDELVITLPTEPT